MKNFFIKKAISIITSGSIAVSMCFPVSAHYVKPYNIVTLYKSKVAGTLTEPEAGTNSNALNVIKGVAGTLTGLEMGTNSSGGITGPVIGELNAYGIKDIIEILTELAGDALASNEKISQDAILRPNKQGIEVSTGRGENKFEINKLLTKCQVFRQFVKDENFFKNLSWLDIKILCGDKGYLRAFNNGEKTKLKNKCDLKWYAWVSGKFFNNPEEEQDIINKTYVDCRLIYTDDVKKTRFEALKQDLENLKELKSKIDISMFIALLLIAENENGDKTKLESVCKEYKLEEMLDELLGKNKISRDLIAVFLAAPETQYPVYSWLEKKVQKEKDTIFSDVDFLLRNVFTDLQDVDKIKKVKELGIEIANEISLKILSVKDSESFREYLSDADSVHTVLLKSDFDVNSVVGFSNNQIEQLRAKDIKELDCALEIEYFCDLVNFCKSIMISNKSESLKKKWEELKNKIPFTNLKFNFYELMATWRSIKMTVPINISFYEYMWYCIIGEFTPSEMIKLKMAGIPFSQTTEFRNSFNKKDIIENKIDWNELFDFFTDIPEQWNLVIEKFKEISDGLCDLEINKKTAIEFCIKLFTNYDFKIYSKEINEFLKTKMDYAKELFDLGATASEIMDYIKFDFSKEEAMTLKKNFISPQEAKIFKDHYFDFDKLVECACKFQNPVNMINDDNVEEVQNTQSRE